MLLSELYQRAEALSPLVLSEALTLWQRAPLDELMAVAHRVRLLHVPELRVTWQIDRNINITNACAARCLFCGFHAGAGNVPLFTTTKEEYRIKIEELLAKGGDQILLQGGLDPRLTLEDYESLFRWLKQEYPTVKLHALGPPEIVFIAQQAHCSTQEVLERLVASGLDSLPGAGAEILSERVRQKISPRKATAAQWIAVMREAQALGMLTSATMMYGHVETIEERINHLLLLRDLQAESIRFGRRGFLAFIAWPYQGNGTRLAKMIEYHPVGATEHLRLIALARILLTNIPHIQASWLTVGQDVAALSLWGGADDMGSIMIEENVVSSTGTNYKMDAEGMVALIRNTGFTPARRNQAYELI
jgi:radical SAM domain protein, cofH subfamily